MVFNDWMNWPDWVFPVGLIGLALIVMLAVVTVRSLLKRIVKATRRGCRAIHFRLVFGLWPSKDPLERKICQAAVDEVLRRSETSFRGWCSEQEDLDRKYSSGLEEVRDPRKDFSHARRVRWNLWWAKRRFYGACDTAKKFGFAVQPGYPQGGGR